MEDDKKLRLFIDTEFCTLKAPYHLLSLGLVAEDGNTFYGELRVVNWDLCTPFVLQNVVPYLYKDTSRIFTMAELSKEVEGWIEPYLGSNVQICYGFEGDVWLLRNLLSHGANKKITSKNIYPQIDPKKERRFFKESKLPQHHALADALATKFAFHAIDAPEHTSVHEFVESHVGSSMDHLKSR